MDGGTKHMGAFTWDNLGEQAINRLLFSLSGPWLCRLNLPLGKIDAYLSEAASKIGIGLARANVAIDGDRRSLGWYTSSSYKQFGKWFGVHAHSLLVCLYFRYLYVSHYWECALTLVHMRKISAHCS